MKRNIKPIFIIILLLMSAACGKGQQVEPILPNSEPTVLTDDTATSESTDTPAQVEETTLSVDFVTFENERFSLEYPESWFKDSLAGLGFFASDPGIQNTWYTDLGPVVEVGAAVIVLAGAREELSITGDASALQVMTSTPLDGNCEWTIEPTGVKINRDDAATSRFLCSSETGVDTIVISTLILRENQAASLTGLVAALDEDELLPVVETIINSFQFVVAQ